MFHMAIISELLGRCVIVVCLQVLSPGGKAEAFMFFILNICCDRGGQLLCYRNKVQLTETKIRAKIKKEMFLQPKFNSGLLESFS